MLYTNELIEKIEKMALPIERADMIIRFVRQAFFDGFSQGYDEGFNDGYSKAREDYW